MSTKEAILFALKNAEKKYVSGEDLARKLSLSRSAVWKHVSVLKREGYEIESSSRLGYLLKSSPDLMLPSELRYKLETKAFGRAIHYFKEIESTNTKAKELAYAGASEGTLVIAERQTGGRGRREREWFSPYGGICFSLILRPQISPLEISRITLLAGVSAVQAIEKISGFESEIKWPNDVLVNGKKVVGILTEMETEADTIHFVVLGIGINANIEAADFPQGLRESATSLRIILGKKVDRRQLAGYLLKKLEDNYNQLENNNFSDILRSWKRSSAILGFRVRVETVGRAIEGKAVDVNDQGALIVETDSGATETIWSGDVVSLR